MAMLSASAPRILNIAARRDTLAIAAAAVVALAALAYGHHGESGSMKPAAQGWTGNLTPATAGAVPVEPMRSSSLVVPKETLTLPPLPAKPIVRAKNSCDSADRLCVVRPIAVIAVPPKRQIAAMEPRGALVPPGLIPMPGPSGPVTKPAAAESKGFSLNPLNHIPDMATVGRPFTAAGQAVSGWIKWL